jgi:hypothetical protein
VLAAAAVAPAAGQQQGAAAFAWPVVPAVAGVHHLQPEPGPIGPEGWPKSTAGALTCRWSCTTCGKSAGNSSRLFELLRTPCGQQGEWRQLKHEAQAAGGRVRCSRCGTERQQCVQLGLQLCPVRVHYRAGEELPAATAVYAAWHSCVKEMHTRSKANGQLQAEAAAAVAIAVAPAPVAAAAAVVQEPVLQPLAAKLRPFRSHVCVRAGEVEFCMLCFAKAPRYRVALWRQGCCDGAAPIGSCPKHTLAAASLCNVQWPPQHAVRVASILEAVKAWQDSHVFKQRRPPKRRVPARVAEQ